MVLVGNKTDLSSKRVVKKTAAQGLAKTLGMVGYVETSVKNNTNLRNVGRWPVTQTS